VLISKAFCIASYESLVIGEGIILLQIVDARS